jgi:hypothetical protein
MSVSDFGCGYTASYCSKVCAAGANFPVSGIFDYRELTPAKAQSTPSSAGRDELSWRTVHRYFPGFAAFSPLREIFRVSVAALPR